MDESELYSKLWQIINAYTTFTKNGFIKRVSTQLPKELCRFCMEFINKEGKEW